MLATMTLATSMAAREGPIPMAGHQICLQVWLVISLLTDALALSGQVNGHGLSCFRHLLITSLIEYQTEGTLLIYFKSISGALVWLCTIDFWQQGDKFINIGSGMSSLCWTGVHHDRRC